MVYLLTAAGVFVARAANLAINMLLEPREPRPPVPPQTLPSALRMGYM